MNGMPGWARWVVFAATWGIAPAACGLDVQGLATADGGWDEVDAASGLDGSGAQSFDAAVAPDASKAPPVGHGHGDDAASDDAAADAVSLDAPAEAGNPCDQDGDGHLAAGGSCQGDDCCDTDPQAHPGQGNFFTQPDHCGSFDYDCDGKLTPEYGAVSCTWYGFGCSGDGFQSPLPACGTAGTYQTCNLGLFTCNTSNAARVQGCR